MNKALLASHILVFCLLTISAHPIHAKNIILNDIDWPPYLFPNANKQHMGIGKEIFNQCLDSTEYKIYYEQLPIKRTHLFMQSGQLDISLYSYKKEREEFVIYGKVPIFNSENGFAVRADSNIQINTLVDLRPYIIGHLAGLTHTPELLKIINRKRKLAEVTEGHSIDSMFAQLLSNTPRFDIMPNSKDTFYWRAKTLGVSDKIRVLDYTIANKDYFVTVSKFSKNINDIPLFLDQMDACIRQLHKNGKYLEIAQHYGRKQAQEKQ
jgi:polar amino acid transport system substrate-binding protein